MGSAAVVQQEPAGGTQADQRAIGNRLDLRDAAFAHRRCLVPAAAYYEWRDDPDGKTPFAVARKDGDPVAFAGIWEAWRSPEGEMLQTFATITTEANRQLSAIQDRMPVLLEQADRPLWLGEKQGDVAALLRPAAEDVLCVWPVDRRVGNVKSETGRTCSNPSSCRSRSLSCFKRMLPFRAGLFSPCDARYVRWWMERFTRAFAALNMAFSSRFPASTRRSNAGIGAG